MRHHYWTDRPCQFCGENLKGKRGDSKYCSPNCRKAASRRAANVQKQAKEIIRRINVLADDLRNDDLKQSVLAALSDIGLATADLARKRDNGDGHT